MNQINEILGKLENELVFIKDLADKSEEDLKVISEISKKLFGIYYEMEQEYKRRSRAIINYNREVDKINRYGKKVMEIAKEPLPVEIDFLPDLSQFINKDKEDIYHSVNSAARELPNIKERACGVYFLLRDHEIVYIGQSVDCYTRLRSHAQDSTKEFNRACYVPVPKEDLDNIEETLISLFKPEYNKKGVNVSYSGNFFV